MQRHRFSGLARGSFATDKTACPCARFGASTRGGPSATAWRCGPGISCRRGDCRGAAIRYASWFPLHGGQEVFSAIRVFLPDRWPGGRVEE